MICAVLKEPEGQLRLNDFALLLATAK